jgi:cell division septum initiation protein DivIVA
MANKKTADELRADAKALIAKARQQEQELLKQAKEIEAENFRALGELAYKFLKNEIGLDDLKSKAVKLGMDIQNGR